LRPLAEKAVGRTRRQGVEDELERGFVRDMTATLTVHKFGLDFQFLSSDEKVHSARGLPVTSGEGKRFCRQKKRIAILNSQLASAFHGNQCPVNGFIP
jgi:hypothetical protein